MKLWEKGKPLNKKIEQFTIGNDQVLDIELAWFDVLGTIAHVEMLASIDLLSGTDLSSLIKELRNLLKSILPSPMIQARLKFRLLYLLNELAI